MTDLHSSFEMLRRLGVVGSAEVPHSNSFGAQLDFKESLLHPIYCSKPFRQQHRSKKNYK